MEHAELLGLGLLALVLLVGAIVLGILYALTAGKRAQAERDAATARARSAQLERELAQFERFRGIVDAEAAAAELRRKAGVDAAQVAANAAQQAAAIIADANAASAQAARTRAQADAASAASRSQADATSAALHAQAEAAAAATRAQAESAAVATLGQADAAAAATRSQSEAYAQALVAQAQRAAAEMTESARRWAEETAAEALSAVRDAKRYEATARAMKNVVEGYGNAYLLPSASVLDELAEEFGFTEAGQRLKSARERARAMTKARTAAACDYVEVHRKEVAVDFVMDAFNGKVDTILSGVRHDNLGTLQEKIRDAFTLVNHNGEAFRKARITPEYLDARLDELRWAVVANELKLRDREEQRALKEKIREEERAQREFERAMKEAEKEEDTLRRAMEKARREVEKATDEQRVVYEEQLRQLTAKLLEAEAKNQRALSMAQQTKAGHVYVISNVGSFGEHVYKIGMTRRLEPRDRVRELGDASVPFEFDVHALIPCNDAPALELALHKCFVQRQLNKVNPRKEFFRVSIEEIRTEVERMGTAVAWTMTAECREYRESQSLEQAMAAKTIDANAWSEAQIKVLKSDRPRAERGDEDAMAEA